MNFDSIKKDDQSKVGVEVVQKQKQEYKLIDTFMRTPGLLLFGYNDKTGDIYEVQEDDRDTIYWEEALDLLHKKVANIDPRDTFFEALNMKNAEKKVSDWKKGKKRDLSNLKKRGKIEF